METDVKLQNFNDMYTEVKAQLDKLLASDASKISDTFTNLKMLEEHNMRLVQLVDEFAKMYYNLNTREEDGVKEKIKDINRSVVTYNKAYAHKYDKLVLDHYDSSLNEGYRIAVPLFYRAVLPKDEIFVDGVDDKYVKVKGMSKGTLMLSKFDSRRWKALDGEVITKDGIYKVPAGNFKLRAEYSEDILPIGMIVELI